jgi:hypothetical protein
MGKIVLNEGSFSQLRDAKPDPSASFFALLGVCIWSGGRRLRGKNPVVISPVQSSGKFPANSLPSSIHSNKSGETRDVRGRREISTNSLQSPCSAAKFADYGHNLKVWRKIVENSLFFSLLLGFFGRNSGRNLATLEFALEDQGR